MPAGEGASRCFVLGRGRVWARELAKDPDWPPATMSRMRDVDPAIIRAQCAADPVKMARQIMGAKIEAGLKFTVNGAEERRRSIRLGSEARCCPERRRNHDGRKPRRCGLLAILQRHRPARAEGRQSPTIMLRFANRKKGAKFLGPKHAAHPINAMLNYCYVVEAGRLAKALAAQGFALPISYLHSDKKGRNSLVWDAIKPLRPSIDAKVFAFIEAHEFARSDFPQSGYNVHRLSRDVTQLLLHRASLPAREIEEAADWIVKTIIACVGQAPRSKIDPVGKKGGRSARSSAMSGSGRPSPILAGRRNAELGPHQL
jgi:hypothetical protein